MEESRRAFYQSLLHREIAPALGTCSGCADCGLCRSMPGRDTGGNLGKDKPVYTQECHECGNSGYRYDGT